MMESEKCIRESRKGTEQYKYSMVEEEEFETERSNVINDGNNNSFNLRNGKKHLGQADVNGRKSQKQPKQTENKKYCDASGKLSKANNNIR